MFCQKRQLHYNILRLPKETKQQENHVKDLGIILSEDASFNNHIIKIISEFKQFMGLTQNLQNERSTNDNTMGSLIIPQPDYCNWKVSKNISLPTSENIKTTQAIQKLDYWQRLTEH